MQILAFSDLHGHAATLKLLRDSIEDENYDHILVAGDLTNADLISSPEAVLQQVKEMFSIMESFKIPYYYVWGTPNREGYLATALESKHETNSPLVDIFYPLVIREKIKHFLSSLNFGKYLKEEEPVRLGAYWLTSSPRRMPKNAIFLQHNYRKIIPKALLQLDGHLHWGQHVLNYLNLGFLYRDAAHNASPMIGCYWELALEGSNVSVNFKNLDGKLKEFICPDHPGEGTFYIPYYWKKCPICFNPDEAINREKK